MSDIDKERHTIQPFIDWLIDNNKVEKSTLLFSYMETYLAEFKKSKAIVDEANKEPSINNEALLCVGRKVLHLTLKRKWYDLIASGNKTEEYREIKDYWEKRFVVDFDPINKNWNERQLPCFKQYDVIAFKNGYSKDAPTMIVELNAFSIGFGKECWGAKKGTKYFVLHLGKVLFDNAIH